MLPTGQSARRRPGVRPALLLPVQARMWGTRVLGTAPQSLRERGPGATGVVGARWQGWPPPWPTPTAHWGTPGPLRNVGP